MRVSEEIRRNNSKAVRNRDKWRRRYKKVSTLIKHFKGEVKFAESRGWPAVNEREILRSLQWDAAALMIERVWITEDLKATAYQYE